MGGIFNCMKVLVNYQPVWPPCWFLNTVNITVEDLDFISAHSASLITAPDEAREMARCQKAIRTTSLPPLTSLWPPASSDPSLGCYWESVAKTTVTMKAQPKQLWASDMLMRGEVNQSQQETANTRNTRNKAMLLCEARSLGCWLAGGKVVWVLIWGPRVWRVSDCSDPWGGA